MKIISDGLLTKEDFLSLKESHEEETFTLEDFDTLSRTKMPFVLAVGVIHKIVQGRTVPFSQYYDGTSLAENWENQGYPEYSDPKTRVKFSHIRFYVIKNDNPELAIEMTPTTIQDQGLLKEKFWQSFVQKQKSWRNLDVCSVHMKKNLDISAKIGWAEQSLAIKRTVYGYFCLGNAYLEKKGYEKEATLAFENGKNLILVNPSQQDLNYQQICFLQLEYLNIKTLRSSAQGEKDRKEVFQRLYNLVNRIKEFKGNLPNREPYNACLDLAGCYKKGYGINQSESFFQLYANRRANELLAKITIPKNIIIGGHR